MRILAYAVAALAMSAQANEPVLLRPSAQLLFKHPAMLQPGQCVRYEEGGAGWVMTERQLRLWVSAEGERRMDENQCLPGRLQPQDIARMAELVAQLPKPMLAFCRTGARSGRLFIAGQQG